MYEEPGFQLRCDEELLIRSRIYPIYLQLIHGIYKGGEVEYSIGDDVLESSN